MTTDTEVVVRPYEPRDARACETVTRDAFWNVYAPGCHEHLLWHRLLAGHPDLLPELTFVAEAAGEVVGCIVGTRGRVVAETAGREAAGSPVVNVGPLGVLPAWQRRGIGGRLLVAFLERARATGETAAFLYGDPGYYPRFGFADAAPLGITTAEGDNFADFMAAELVPGALAGVTGRLIESAAFEPDRAELDAFDATFPPREKRLPG